MKKIIGTYRIPEKRIFSKSYESPKYFTEIEVKPCTVDVYRFNQDACYDVTGVIVFDDTIGQIGKIDSITAQPYAYMIIEDKNFTPNDQFFVEFPHLKTINPENIMNTEKLYVVIDNDSKEAVSISVKKTAAERWAAEFNENCHLCGGSSTQYGISEAE